MTTVGYTKNFFVFSSFQKVLSICYIMCLFVTRASQIQK